MGKLHLRRGDSVRLYQEDEWFIDGTICYIDEDENTVDVDYGDFVQRYPRPALRLCWPADGSYESVLVPFQDGERVEDFSIAA